MSQQEIIIQMMQEYGRTGFHTGPVSENRIEQIEKSLNLELPESYKWFVRNYGYGGIEGVVIEGVAKTEVPTTVEATEDYRKYGLPKSYVVIQNLGEYMWCLDTGNMKNGECPVVNWSQVGGLGKLNYESFYSYLIDRFQESIDNLDDDDGI
ncbi:SMI1-KNR4 cell-wall [Marininema mesophilum]|uniref:SMI1-KNR4 cell-wall n=1 Tax=Marininema mesophilum TaxID=1048340 RepID=A0A1H2S826_9BACL|nr:SMI1/KNR4 family protein [Marininema mesophilum]SDW27688.1 SMI1-KNR4 cell-wall [Marininema mesophilum]